MCADSYDVDCIASGEGEQPIIEHLIYRALSYQLAKHPCCIILPLTVLYADARYHLCQSVVW